MQLIFSQNGSLTKENRVPHFWGCKPIHHRKTKISSPVQLVAFGRLNLTYLRENFQTLFISHIISAKRNVSEISYQASTF